MDVDFRLTDYGMGKVYAALCITEQLIVAQCFFNYNFRRVRNNVKNDY